MYTFDHPRISGARGNPMLWRWVWESLMGQRPVKDSAGRVHPIRIGQERYDPAPFPDLDSLIVFIERRVDRWITRHGRPYVTVSVPYYWRLGDNDPNLIASYYSFELYSEEEA